VGTTFCYFSNPTLEVSHDLAASEGRPRMTQAATSHHEQKPATELLLIGLSAKFAPSQARSHPSSSGMFYNKRSFLRFAHLLESSAPRAALSLLCASSTCFAALSVVSWVLLMPK
jgi:hypothetical protein